MESEESSESVDKYMKIVYDANSATAYKFESDDEVKKFLDYLGVMSWDNYYQITSMTPFDNAEEAIVFLLNQGRKSQRFTKLPSCSSATMSSPFDGAIKEMDKILGSDIEYSWAEIGKIGSITIELQKLRLERNVS